MKLKNTLGLAIGSLLPPLRSALWHKAKAQLKSKASQRKNISIATRNFKNDGNLFGGSVGYFLTDDVELRLAYDEVHNAVTDDGQ